MDLPLQAQSGDVTLYGHIQLSGKKELKVTVILQGRKALCPTCGEGSH